MAAHRSGKVHVAMGPANDFFGPRILNSAMGERVFRPALDSKAAQVLGQVCPVIAEQSEEAMLGKRRHLDTSRAENGADAVRRILKFERDLRQQIGKHLNQLWDT